MKEALKVVGECFERMAINKEKGPQTSAAPATSSQYYAVSAHLQKQYAIISVPVAFPVSVAPVALSAVPASSQNACTTERVPIAWLLGVESVPGTALAASFLGPNGLSANACCFSCGTSGDRDVLNDVASCHDGTPDRTSSTNFANCFSDGSYYSKCSSYLVTTHLELSGFQFRYIGWSRYFDK